ncbi:MAG: InlB B-repeat-containing protein [Firmicutes bacterium]|nr:InlB B-repeat-containing protein [Bacillota bacterium]
MAKNTTPNDAPAESLEGLLARAENRLFLKQTKEAEAAYLAAVQKYPDDWRAWFGMVKFHTENFTDYLADEALYAEELARAREKVPESDRARLESEYRHYVQKRQEAAEREKKKEEERYRTGGAERFKNEIEGEQRKSDAKIKKIGIIAGAALAVVIVVVVIAVLVSQNAAKDSADTYSFTYRYTDASGATVTVKGKFKYGIDKINAPEERAGFVFAWYLSSDCNPGSRYNFDKRPSEKAFELWTKWILLRTVTFDSLEGSPVEPVTAEEGGAVLKPADPTRTGFRFDGWCADAACTTKAEFPVAVASNLTLYAKWVQQITATFDTGEGSAVPPVTLDKGASMAKPATDPTCPGHDFDGWFKDVGFATPVQFPYVLEENVTLHAKWKPRVPIVTVTYIYPEGAKGIAERAQYVERDSEIEAWPEMTFSGHTFAGWFLDEECEIPAPTLPHLVTGDLELYAKFDIIPGVLPNG